MQDPWQVAGQVQGGGTEPRAQAWLLSSKPDVCYFFLKPKQVRKLR